MRTKTFPVLSLLMLALLIPASSSSNLTQISPTSNSSTVTNDTTTSAKTPVSVDPSSAITPVREKVNTTSTPPSVSPSHITEVSQHPQSMNTPAPSSESHIGLAVFIVLVILVFGVVVGFLFYMKRQQPGQESAVARFLLGVRDRLRTRIGNLEDRMGVRLRPGGKTGEEEDVEEADGGQTEEAGQQRDGDGEGGSRETSNENKEKDKEEEDSETSDECSSVEGEDLRENVLNRQEEEEKNQSKAEDEDDTSSGSDGGQSAAEGDSGGDKKVDSEEVALMNCPQEDDENIDLCDVTVL